MATLTTLTTFNGSDGSAPQAGLIFDAGGNLYGTTSTGGANGDGTVFELANTGSGYASTPTPLVSFNGTNGSDPTGSLVMDAQGDLFGTTSTGGANGDGTVFEIVNTGTPTAPVYSGTPTTLVGFNGTDGANPASALIFDAKGDLLGTTAKGGSSNDGTAFEITPTGNGGYSSTPTTLVAFNGMNGANPSAALVADASGNLYGTTNNGVVFEIAKTSTGYANSATVLATGLGVGLSALSFDVNGDLFGTTALGPEPFFGSVFELVKGADGYTANTLVAIPSHSGFEQPESGVIIDANGNLWGTTYFGEVGEAGVPAGMGGVFELPRTSSGYPTRIGIVANFADPPNAGSGPVGSLVVDSAGDLYGVTSGGDNNSILGTVFEVTDSGYATTPEPVPTGLALAAASVLDSGVLGDTVTDVTMPVITGFGVAGATVTLDDGTTQIGSATVGSNGTWSVMTSALTPGAHSLTALESSGVGEVSYASAALALSVVTPPPAAGSGAANLVWRDANGSLIQWTLNGSSQLTTFQPLTYQGSPVAPEPTWSFLGFVGGDNLISQNTNGELLDWTISGSQITSVQALDYQGSVVTPDPTWNPLGIGNFDGAGADDLLSRNSDGTLLDWTINGAQITSSEAVTYQGVVAPDPTWSLLAIGNFGGGSIDDVISRNTDGTLLDWTMNGSQITSSQPVTYQGVVVAPDPTSTLVAVGDFGGTGTDSMLWQNTDGMLLDWTMNGSQIASVQAVSYQGSAVSLDASWSIVGVGDFTGNGNDDLVLRNTDGALIEWTMNGSQITSVQGLSYQSVFPAPDDGWQTERGLTTGIGGKQVIAGGSTVANPAIGAGDSLALPIGAIVSGPITFLPGGTGLLYDADQGSDTVMNFQTGVDHLSYFGETTAINNAIVAAQQSTGGNTVLTFPDSTSVTLVGLTHVNAGVFV